VRTIEIKRYPAKNCIERCSHALIRPPRFLYNEDILNPRKKHGNRFKHSVFYIPFALSLYSPKNMKYVVLYLHGNSSSRYEGFNHLPNLPDDVGLACFDFDGCGLRTGRDYISLGKHEAAEVDVAVRFLKGRGLKVVGWGRSMGAVSLLLSS
jgi:pimeloyl-ACP methyl ester carboxylesterase